MVRGGIFLWIFADNGVSIYIGACSHSLHVL